MKALSLIQPWAALVVAGVKTRETRSWRTKHRGLLAIHASKGLPRYAKDIAKNSAFVEALSSLGYADVRDLPRGSILGYVELVDCVPTSTIAWEDQDPFGDYGPERFAWIFKDPRTLPAPVECKGALSLWKSPLSIHSGGYTIDSGKKSTSFTLATTLYPHASGISKDLTGQRFLFDDRTTKVGGLL